MNHHHESKEGWTCLIQVQLDDCHIVDADIFNILVPLTVLQIALAKVEALSFSFGIWERDEGEREREREREREYSHGKSRYIDEF